MGTYIAAIVSNWNSLMNYFNDAGAASVKTDTNNDMKSALVLAKVASKVMCKIFNLCAQATYSVDSNFRFVADVQ